MKVNEIFYSIQGEGKYMGLPMAFLRVTGCNLRCQWCDTKYAYDDGKELSIDTILEQLGQIPTKRICITGGEPMIQEQIIELITQLTITGYTIYLETNGSMFLGKLPHSNAIRISLDIKCPSSNESQKMNFTNFEILGEGDQIKFIIVNLEDYDYAKDILKKYPISEDCTIIFTPCDLSHGGKIEGGFSLQKLTDKVLKDGLSVRVLPQLHKLIWPEKDRGI